MGFEAAHSLPDGSWNSKHEAGRLQGLHWRVEREGAVWDPWDVTPERLLDWQMLHQGGLFGVKTGLHFTREPKKQIF